jgi:hypothetical protein
MIQAFNTLRGRGSKFAIHASYLMKIRPFQKESVTSRKVARPDLGYVTALCRKNFFMPKS